MIIQKITDLAKNDQLTGHLFLRPCFWYGKQIQIILAPFPTFATGWEQAIGMAKRTSQFVIFIVLPFVPVIVSGAIGVVIKLIAPLPPARKDITAVLPVRQNINVVVLLDVISKIILDYLFDSDWNNIARVCRQWHQVISEQPKRQILTVISKIKAKTLSTTVHPDLPIWRDERLSKIVDIEAQHDLAGAKATAVEIKDNCCRVWAFIEIAKVDKHYDFSEAKATAKQIQSPPDEDRALIEIVKVEAQRDLAEAKATAVKIQDNYCRFLAHLEIAKVDERHDLAEAKATASQIQSPPVKDRALIEIVKVEAMHSLAATRATAAEIQDDYYRVLALLEIAKVDERHDFSEAKIIASQINHITFEHQALVEIVKVEALYDLGEAKMTAERIKSAHYKDLAFVEIKKQLNLNGTKVVVKGIQDRYKEARERLVQINRMLQ